MRRKEDQERWQVKLKEENEALRAEVEAWQATVKQLRGSCEFYEEKIKTLEAALAVANEKLVAAEPEEDTREDQAIDALIVKAFINPEDEYPIPEPGDDMSLREVDDKPSEAEEARP